MASTVKRTPCDYCGSSNNVNWFKNQQGVMTSRCLTPDCEYNSRKPNIMQFEQKSLELITSGYEFTETYRGISADVMNLYGFKKATFHNQECIIEPHVDLETGTTIVAQKLRLPSKTFPSTGNIKKAAPFGWQLYKDQKKLIITEGALDAASIYQVLGDDIYHIVSLKCGAGDQTKGEIEQYLEVFERYENIVIAFDMDKSGDVAYNSIIRKFNPGVLGRIQFSYKDANEYLKINEEDKLRSDILNWKLFIPDSLRKPSMKSLLLAEEGGINIPYPQLNNVIRGLKPKRLYTLLAGSGIGKSSFTKEIVFDLINKKHKVGIAYLEEPLETTGRSFIAMDNDQPLYEVEENPRIIKPEDFQKSYDKYIDSNLLEFMDASFMKIDGDNLLYSLEYMITVLKCKFIVLDHLTMITYDGTGESSERKDIDKLMKALRELVHKTGASVITVVHLKRPQFGKSWAEGREVNMTDARGSAAIEQLSDVMIALERNMLDEFQKSKTKVKVLKNRITGKTGYVDELVYLENTGRLVVL